jgi:hypothetical protein
MGNKTQNKYDWLFYPKVKNSFDEIFAVTQLPTPDGEPPTPNTMKQKVNNANTTDTNHPSIKENKL